MLRSHALMPRVISALHASARQEPPVALAGSAVLFVLCNDASNKDLVSLPVCQTMLKMLAAAPPLAVPGASAPKAGGGSSRPWSKKAKTAAGPSGGAGQGVCEREGYVKVVKRVEGLLEGQGADIAGGLRAAGGDRGGGLEEVLSAEHLVVCAASGLSAQHPAFRDLFRAAGGLTACATILADSLLALSLGGGGKVAMWRLVRDLRLLETLTFMSLDNQNVVFEAQPQLVAGLLGLISSLTDAMRGDEGSAGFAGECRLGAMKLLVNLTNHNPAGTKQVS